MSLHPLFAAIVASHMDAREKVTKAVTPERYICDDCDFETDQIDTRFCPHCRGSVG